MESTTPIPIDLKLMEDSVDHDIRILGERNWSNFASNRDDCRKLLKKARAQAGLSSQ
jgi:hypothetical protein